mmetsp:Transcript_21430/g.44692  ORF Transcript_21430/g.44692 Transcript_21430/m.44692 type:complete len:250 (-) Transcript_21430:490-1239(-)
MVESRDSAKRRLASGRLGQIVLRTISHAVAAGAVESSGGMGGHFGSRNGPRNCRKRHGLGMGQRRSQSVCSSACGVVGRGYEPDVSCGSVDPDSVVTRGGFGAGLVTPTRGTGRDGPLLDLVVASRTGHRRRHSHAYPLGIHLGLCLAEPCLARRGRLSAMANGPHHHFSTRGTRLAIPDRLARNLGHHPVLSRQTTGAHCSARPAIATGGGPRAQCRSHDGRTLVPRRSDGAARIANLDTTTPTRIPI